MTKDFLRYDKMVENALRGVVREALSRAAEHGLNGGHHFYITFRTGAPGVVLPDFLRAEYPEDMTIVLEHQFWELAVAAESFSVMLSFRNQLERLTIPFAAISAFADPSVKFGLQFQPDSATSPLPSASGPSSEEKRKKPAPALVAVPSAAETKADPAKPGDNAAADKKPGEVVALDTFRKK
jgi:hypothetical protein